MPAQAAAEAGDQSERLQAYVPGSEVIPGFAFAGNNATPILHGPAFYITFVLYHPMYFQCARDWECILSAIPCREVSL